MSAIRGVVIGKKICEAIGLNPDKVSRLIIDIPAGDLVTVTVFSTTAGDTVESIINEVTQYQLVKKDDTNADSDAM